MDDLDSTWFLTLINAERRACEQGYSVTRVHAVDATLDIEPIRTCQTQSISILGAAKVRSLNT